MKDPYVFIPSIERPDRDKSKVPTGRQTDDQGNSTSVPFPVNGGTPETPRVDGTELPKGTKPRKR